MKSKEWQVAIFGTFDVENYGDLLFPIIAEAELTKRMGSVKLHRFSYHAKAPPEWPYTVTSLTELPALVSRLDGALIGGGFIIRFDKDVAAGYGPPTAAIHHPTGYWLTPALIALQYGVPLMWNAPGMHCNDIPAWAEPLLKLAFENSSYITVRDQPSKTILSRFVSEAEISVLPDTAFGISQLIDEEQPSPEFVKLLELSGLTEPYILVQAANCLDSFLHLIRNYSPLPLDLQILVLPIGPVLGDDKAILGDDLPGAVYLHCWPHPLLAAELISRAAAVIGHSYHLAITALAFGVPVFSSADLSAGKYTSLSDFETIYPLPAEIEPQWFISRLGKKRPSPAANEALDQLSDHWDHIAKMLCEGSTAAHVATSRFWQSLPNILEAASNQSDKLNNECIHKQQCIDEQRELIASAQKTIATLHNSHSMQITAPLRFLRQSLKHLLDE